MTIKNTAGTAKTKTETLAAMTEVTPDENKVYRFGETDEWFQHETLPGHTTIDGDKQLAFSPQGLYTLAEINDFFPAAVIDEITVAATGAAPTALATAGGTVLRITGDNLTGVTNVGFEGGDNGTSLTIVSRYEILVTTPAKSAGTYDVVLTDDSGTVTEANAVTFA